MPTFKKTDVMMTTRSLLALLCLTITSRAFAQADDETAIRKLLNEQAAAWNAGSIDRFMTGYWHSDSLAFVEGSTVRYGYDSTLAGYRKGYPDRARMGTLHFEILDVRRFSPRDAWVLGRWHLKRKSDEPGGLFTLLLRKIGGKWLIVVDHTSQG